MLLSFIGLALALLHGAVRIRVRLPRLPYPKVLASLISTLGAFAALSLPAGASTGRKPFPPRSTAGSPELPWSPAGGPLSPPPAGAKGPLESRLVDQEDKVRHPAIHGERLHGRPAGRLFPRASSPADLRVVEKGAPLPDAPSSTTKSQPERGRRGSSPRGIATTTRTPVGANPTGRKEGHRTTTDIERDERQACMSRHPSGKKVSQAPSARRVPGCHVVQRGESLWQIAAHKLATDDVRRIARYWPKIHRANRATIGHDPNLILPGQRLTLPDED
jgi:hypothetical protein